MNLQFFLMVLKYRLLRCSCVFAPRVQIVADGRSAGGDVWCESATAGQSQQHQNVKSISLLKRRALTQPRLLAGMQHCRWIQNTICLDASPFSHFVLEMLRKLGLAVVVSFPMKTRGKALSATHSSCTCTRTCEFVSGLSFPVPLQAPLTRLPGTPHPPKTR
jgi:hypothetical protein